ncbi:MAG: cytochrome P450 [Myxococcota bacterium]
MSISTPHPSRGWLTNPLRRRVDHQLGIPVAPGGFPAVGHTPQYALERYAFFCGLKERLGPLFWIDILGGRWLAWLEEDALTWLANRSTSSAEYHSVIGDTFGEGLIIQDGTPHRRARRILNPAFSPGGLGAAEVGPLVKEVIETRIADWQEGRPVWVVKETQAIALHVIFRIMGIPTDKIRDWERLYRRALLAVSPIRSTLPGMPRWWGARAIDTLNAELRALLRRTRAEEGGDGLVAQMVRGRDDGGRQMEEAALVDNLRLLIIAGHETSASSIGWMLLHIAHEPRLWSALVRSVEGVEQIPTSIKALRPFSYAEGLFREALRIHPPVDLVPRRATEEIEVRGHRVPAGTSLALSTMMMSRDPERYPDPLRVDPARWVGQSRPTPIETCQFGSGPHFCLGYNLAMLEGTLTALVLARSLRARGLRPRLASKRLPRPVYVPLVHPPQGAKIVLERA